MATQIKLPHLGEKIESGDVLSILVAAGDTVTVDQDLIEVETDKATMPIPSPEAGKVIKLLVSEGDTIEVGAPILEIEAAEGASNGKPSPEPAEKPAEEKPKPRAEAKSQPETSEAAIPPAPTDDVPAIVEPEPTPKAVVKPSPTKEIPATAGDGHAPSAAGPAVRRLARELGVDLRRVRPASGSRITEEDVRVHVRASNAQAASSVSQGVTPPGTPDSDSHGAVRREKMSRLRQTIARNMFASYSTIPQLTNFDDVDVTELERIRKDSKDDYASQGVKLTSMPFLVKAIATALRQHPIVNASVSESGDEIIYKEYVNIGIAVDTEKGLIVPVLRDADRKSIPQIAREMAAMATAAREGTFAIEDLRGGTFTISNLGAVGGTYSTPIINPPEVAILLVGRSRTLPMYVKEQLEPRLIMPLSITYDHRVVDGAAAARFLNDVKRYLANPGRLLLAP
ncbi:2-oxo acid dehydrogenase subunit E2 [Bythopirellula polymerisocia]|uniref:Dihydrolipoamide acetyltransferase component of pyruvate dehydrogenase complex n=1 Tax=Bythopirellula polymerisocia TaxID=2528003 RepID=A0A5C6D2U9_9BACT|nr:2-oxo acid dehydrogenase subunit E2 [Bythopirellula polymerisocia]TWU30184.1 Dihydrolipoyllysine-residue acetyltransferase component of pyruvate dehydrogenase complex [Bythopirellula polymerisocia]